MSDTVTMVNSQAVTLTAIEQILDKGFTADTVNHSQNTSDGKYCTYSQEEGVEEDKMFFPHQFYCIK